MSAHQFVDPITDKTVILHVDPAARLFDALTVEHPGCERRADVSADLDCFFCPSCGWNGRISGAWAVDKWDQAQPARAGGSGG